jgi:hypothetical protein
MTAHVRRTAIYISGRSVPWRQRNQRNKIPIDYLQREFDRITEIQGRDWDIAPKLPSLLRETSFETVDTIEHVCPFGTWPKDPKLKEVGRYFRAQMVEGAMESYSLALFTRFGGWRPVEVQVLLAHLRAEIQSNKIHAYSKLSVEFLL